MVSNPLLVEIGPLKFSNPVIVASGTFGYARELAGFIDLNLLGGIVTKTVTQSPRLGNNTPRIVETPSGMLNSIGLQNVGVERFIKEKLPFLAALKVVVIVSIMGYTVEEFVGIAKRFNSVLGIDALELNLSCPNVAYDAGIKSQMFAHVPDLTEQVVSAVRQVSKYPIIAKLGPDVTDIQDIGSAAENAGADALSVMNTIPGMVIDTKSRLPVLSRKTGGLSGPAVRPIAVRLVYELAKRVNIPIIGIGGITDSNDALQFIFAGAHAIQVGSVTFVNPKAPIDILEGIEIYMRNNSILEFSQMIGVAQKC